MNFRIYKYKQLFLNTSSKNEIFNSRNIIFIELYFLNKKNQIYISKYEISKNNLFKKL